MICDQRFGLRDRLSIAAEASKPLDFRVFAEPGELALGVVAMALGGLRNRLVAGELAAQHGNGLGVAERAWVGSIWPLPPPLSFVQRSR